MTFDEERTPTAPAPTGKGVRLTCVFCHKSQSIDTGALYQDRKSAEVYLALITGGRFGDGKIIDEAGFAFEIGKSVCCGVVIDGELYGYDDPEVDTVTLTFEREKL